MWTIFYDLEWNSKIYLYETNNIAVINQNQVPAVLGTYQADMGDIIYLP